MTTTTARNVAALVVSVARQHPQRLALVVPTGNGDACERATFGELAELIEQMARALSAAGYKPGDRVALLAPPGVKFFALALGLMWIGCAVVTIDGALPRKRLVAALKAARVKAVVSLRKVLRLWPLLPVLWRSRLIALDGRALGVTALDQLMARGNGKRLPDATTDAELPGLITFTSGSTGQPKGAIRPHAVLIAQHHALAHEFPSGAHDVDMPCFPAVALHNLCSGMPTIFPPGNLREPAGIDPRRVLEWIDRYQVTRLSGAPAFLSRVASAAITSGKSPATLKLAAAGGAPVSRKLCRQLVRAFPQADLRVLYGSTEAEPIAGCTMQEVADSAADNGFLVGRAHPSATVLLAQLPDPFPADADPRMFAESTGELLVAGSHVVRLYADNPAATAATKLPRADAPDPTAAVWHRTGDLARMDADGRLWLLGRTNDGTHDPPYPIEHAALDVDGVHAAAFTRHSHAPDGELILELEPGGDGAAVRAALPGRAIRVVPRIPMDPRHQSKVLRDELRRMLERD